MICVCVYVLFVYVCMCYLCMYVCVHVLHTSTCVWFVFQVWDLSAGRVLFDKMAHNGPVTAVRFHPKELLLATATGSSDRRVKFWDLDSMSLVSETSPESNGIRCIHFDARGDVLYTGSQDLLKVSTISYGLS